MCSIFALLAVVLLICVTRVAKAALDKALAETGESLDGDAMSQSLPVISTPSVNLHEPLIIKIDTNQDNHEHQFITCKFSLLLVFVCNYSIYEMLHIQSVQPESLVVAASNFMGIPCVLLRLLQTSPINPRNFTSYKCCLSQKDIVVLVSFFAWTFTSTGCFLLDATSTCLTID